VRSRTKRTSGGSQAAAAGGGGSPGGAAASASSGTIAAESGADPASSAAAGAPIPCTDPHAIDPAAATAAMNVDRISGNRPERPMTGRASLHAVYRLPTLQSSSIVVRDGNERLV